MNRVKSNLKSLSLTATMFGFAVLGSNQAMLAQSGEPAGPTKPVVVVNPPSQPVPVTGTVTGNVSITSIPTVDARQSGQWNVGINGTPTVRIDPNANTVQFAPRGTSLVFDSGVQRIASDADRFVRFENINVAPYTSVRVFVVRFAGPGLASDATAFITTRVGSEHYTFDVAQINSTNPNVVKVYDTVGTGLGVSLLLNPGEFVIRVIVFGS